MRDTLNCRVSSLDQFRPAQLAQLLPIFSEDVQRIAVFEVLEDKEAIAEFRAEIPRELSCPDNVAIVPEAIECNEALARNLEAFRRGSICRCKSLQNTLTRSRRQHLPFDVLEPSEILIGKISVVDLGFAHCFPEKPQIE